MDEYQLKQIDETIFTCSIPEKKCHYCKEEYVENPTPEKRYKCNYNPFSCYYQLPFPAQANTIYYPLGLYE